MNKLPLVPTLMLSLTVASGFGPLPAILAQTAAAAIIPDSEARQHLLAHHDPLYPPIAKAAHVEGNVTLVAVVDVNGEVTDVADLNGPPMLLGTTAATVRGWTFRPFQINGSPAEVKVALSIPFSLKQSATAFEAAYQKAWMAFVPEFQHCTGDLAQKHYSNAEESCHRALDRALEFPDPAQAQDAIEGAYEAYGNALIENGKPEAALEQFHTAATLAKKYRFTWEHQYAAAFNMQAVAEQNLHQAKEADRDYTIAEESYRIALDRWKRMNSPQFEAQSKQAFVRCLVNHAALVRAMGDTTRADALTAEAIALDPKTAKHS